MKSSPVTWPVVLGDSENGHLEPLAPAVWSPSMLVACGVRPSWAGGVGSPSSGPGLSGAPRGSGLPTLDLSGQSCSVRGLNLMLALRGDLAGVRWPLPPTSPAAPSHLGSGTLGRGGSL